MSLSWPSKDPDEKLDYLLDWGPRLDDDTIQTATFSLATPAGLTIVVQDYDATTATVWLSGGTDNNTAEILCHIVTVGGRIMEQTVKLKIKAR